jgi:uncharacterized protein YndB with AHSA1/START domain
MATDQISMFGNAPPTPEPTEKPASFTISKSFQGNAQKVFDQWLIPVFIGKWMFNKEIIGEKIVSLDNTVRKGGDYKFIVEKKGKTVEYSGQYLELKIPNQLVFSWVKDGREDRCSRISLRFEEDGTKTKMKFSMKLDPALNDQKESIKRVWNARCTALAERLK